jgi:hypothetical protein
MRKNPKKSQKWSKSPKTGVYSQKAKNPYFPLIYHAKTPIYRNNSAIRTSKNPTTLIIALWRGFTNFAFLDVILLTSALLFEELVC